VLAADHRPERAMVLRPLHKTYEAARARDVATAPTAPRPTWLLPAPQRLQEDPAFGRPLHQGAPLVLATRAERIEAGWFDGELISRDYHVAQAKDHRWLWVFRERQQWYLHGVFG
jgi:protein ImuB